MSDSEDSEEAGYSGTSTPPKKKVKMWYQQAFKKEWMEDDQLKDWIQPDPKDKYAVLCTVCSSKMKNCNKSSLFAHKVSMKHVKNVNAKKETVSIVQHFKKAPGLGQQDKVAKAELLISGFMAEHNMPFRQADHLVDVFKRAFPDSEIAKEVSLKKTKASYVLQDGIAWDEYQKIVNICKENKFSLVIDESTDVSVSQNLALVIRFYDKDRSKVTDAFLDTVEVDDGSAKGLYSAVKKVFNSKEIPMNNIIGFASDNCSTMLGANNGFQALLKKDFPSVFVMGCICHSFALCASHASSKLPSWLETLLKDICCYFSRSSKRNHEFQLIQEVLQAPRHKMLKLAQTRWLSRGMVVSRVLEQWDALSLFFQCESRTDKVDGASQIYKVMTNRGTKHMLVFLNYILAKVDKMNVEFQSQHFKLGTLYSTISDEYRSILGLFLQDAVIQSRKLSDIDPNDESLHKKLEDMSLGGRCEGLLETEPLQGKEKMFRFDCKNFLVELCLQMKKRFPFEESSIIAMLKAMNPAEALSTDRNLKSIGKLAVHFPTLIKEEELDALQDQWRDLLYAKETLKGLSQSATVFWNDLLSVKDGNNKAKFDLLSKFMCGLLALPHSSACVERIFSQINNIKTKQSNRLCTNTVANRLLAKQAIAREEVTCQNWEPSTSLIREVKLGHCHKRYKEREELRKKSNKATLHHSEPNDANDEELDDDPMPVSFFLQ